MLQLQSIPFYENSSHYFTLIKGLPYACWLDSGRPQSTLGRYDIMTALPLFRLVSRDRSTQIFEYLPEQQKEQWLSTSQDDPMDLLQTYMDKLPTIEDDSLPFTGGALGYFSYDFGKAYVQVEDSHKHQKQFADMHLGIYTWAIIQDHQQRQAWLMHLDSCPQTVLAQVKQALAGERLAAPSSFSLNSLKSLTSKAQYLAHLAQIDRYIHQGDCYQINYAHCFEGRYEGDTFRAYDQLRASLPSPFSAYLQLDQQAILSLSPERFIAVNQLAVNAQPIKGTSPRDTNPLIDRQNAEALQASEKNRAENVMIVDLLRNDLSKHCQLGSVEVNELYKLHSFANVHHLISTVSGKLAQQEDVLPLFRDSFPGGSITGAPKRRAMEIIEELEPLSREVYCGSIGYISCNGNLDMNIAIRTVSCDGEKLRCWGGGGIVADSIPSDEYDESLHKINIILSTLKSAN